jgi:hypothetical protein
MCFPRHSPDHVTIPGKGDIDVAGDFPGMADGSMEARGLTGSGRNKGRGK